jgi:hypothetical protein
MKGLALAVVGAIGLGATPAAKADFWLEGRSFGPAAPDAGAYHDGPYVVAGFGDESLGAPRRYWGGPYWTECSGNNPPFETWSMRCPAAVKIAVREHDRRVKVRLK